MQLTMIGWILIPFGVALYCFGRRYLYPLTICLVPFSATAVANVGSANSMSGVPAALFVGSLWMATEVRVLQRTNSKSRSPLDRARRRLVLFLGIAVLSLIMPVWSNGRIQIDSADLLDNSATPLQLSAKHVTQCCYLAFGVLLSIAIARRNADVPEFMRTMRTFIWSAMFVSFWGILQLSCVWFGVTYPAYIFNSSATPSAQGYAELVDTLGFQRISSVTTEPSIFAVCTLVALLVVLFGAVSRRPIISRVWDRVAAVEITVSLMFSTSTTAYVGIGLALVLYCCALTYVGILAFRHLIKLLAFVGIVAFCYVLYAPVRDLVDVIVLNKRETYSALETLKSYVLAWGYFRSYPILGLGWGSVTSRDLVLKLLSNTGILGFTTFAWFLVTSVLALWRVGRLTAEENQPQRWCAICLLCAYVLVIILNGITGFEYSYAQLWFVIGLAIAVPAMTRTANRGPHEGGPRETA